MVYMISLPVISPDEYPSTVALPARWSAEARVSLVCMPWARPDRPSLALGLLKSVLERAGVRTDVFYANLLITGGLTGLDLLMIGESAIGSLLFTPHVVQHCDRAAIVAQIARLAKLAVLPGTWWQSADGIVEMIDRCDRDLDEVVSRLPLDRLDVVGLSLVFQQTLPSLALARRIKERKPSVNIICGGASCDDEMGPALLEAYPYLDFAISGDGEHGLVQFIRALSGQQPFAEVSGLAFRSDDHVVANPGRPTENLDALPVPDYTEYFLQLAQSCLSSHLEPTLPFESSRGCWWGQKHLCSFCGLNANGVGFRRKKPERVRDEVRALATRYRVNSLFATDNILDMDHLRTVMPVFAQERRADEGDLTFFYEVKSNLKREHIRLLSEAGVRSVQPGIESFSDHVLSLMDKGAIGIQQIQFLRWCEEFGILPTYNIIVNNPGELVEDYTMMQQLIPYVRHLTPPGSISRMMLQRFSPYFERPERYGISAIRPAQQDMDMYGLSATHVRRIAYAFDYRHEDQSNDDLRKAVAEFSALARRWQNTFVWKRLSFVKGPGFVRIYDKRTSLEPDAPAANRTIVLTGDQASIFSWCDAFHTMDAVIEHFPQVDASALRRFVGKMCDRQLMWQDPHGRIISLPIRSHA